MTDDWRSECKTEIYDSQYNRGGQHVGTPKGIKMTHEKYGLTAISEGARSQHFNRMICFDMIEIALTYKDKIR
ncbi:MAG: hypothetical protein H7232_11115 [Aeromicrobium sp.]|nr:hypothetical protein [Burkholderiales bacterium]